MDNTDQIVIGFILPLPEYPFWAMVGQAASAQAGQLGVKLLLSYLRNWTVSSQVSAIQWLMSQQIDALIIAPVDPHDPIFADAIRAAKTAGVQVIAIDSPLGDGLEISAVVSDNRSGAAAAAAELAERLGGRGEVVHLQGLMRAKAGVDRSQGVHEVLDRLPEMALVFEASGDWTQKDGARLMRDALAAHPAARAVIAANDDMALGALDAISAAGRAGEVLVAGFDAMPSALAAIRAGTMTASVSRSPDRMGRIAVDLAMCAVQGEPVPPEVLLDVELITADNLIHATVETLLQLPGLLRNLLARIEERRFQATLLDAVEQAVIAADRDGSITYWNRFAETLFGWPAAKVVGRGNALIMVDPSSEQASALLQFLCGGGRWSGEVTLRRHNGTTFPALVTCSPIDDDRGIVVGGVAIVVDISDRKQAEQQRLALERKLMETQKLESLGVLAGGIAHDFNNLLVAILGNASLALMELSPESPARASVAQIEHAAQRAADLTRQMLAYAGKGRFVIQRLSVNAIVEEMTHLLHVSIPKNVTLRYNLAPQVPAVEADATQIRQVVMNLVVNAADAIGALNGVITITTGAMWADRAYLSETYLAPDLAEGSYVYIEVSDTGSGMSADTRARIFDPFFTTKFTGRGLGLAAVLGIVRGHGGALKVYSEIDRGSTFKLLLPAVDAAPAAQAAAAPRRNEWRGQGSVLVIDDEPGVRAVAARMLARFGFSVLEAQDGAAGVDLLRANGDAITCVLLDMTMPRMSGEETFRLMRQIKPDVRVLLMSGYNEQEATSHFAGKGLAGFVSKPFTAADLRAKLEQLAAMG